MCGAHACAGVPRSGSTATGPTQKRMPRALNGRSVLRQMRSTTACYFLHADGARQQPDGETTWMVVPWRVAACGAGAHMNREAHAHRCQPTPSKNPNPNPNPGVDDRDVYASVLTRGCAALPRQSCPATKSYEATLARWRGVWPSGWVHCEHTISPQPRQMKNLAAFTAGALAYLSLAMPGFLAVENGRARADVRLLHLISYEHMGVARVSCLAGCTCESTIIDAHRIDRRRNVSIYVEKVLPVTFTVHDPMAAARRPHHGQRSPRCKLALRVLQRTSSGEHRWVLTRVTVSTPRTVDTQRNLERTAANR